jgi:hypothetical protein
VARTVALGGIAGTLIAWNWLRLESGPSDGQAVLMVVLALAPAAVRGLRARIATGVVAFLIAAGSAFDLGPGIHYPGRLLARFGQGFLDFYDVKLPFNPAAQPRGGRAGRRSRCSSARVGRPRSSAATTSCVAPRCWRACSCCWSRCGSGRV